LQRFGGSTGPGVDVFVSAQLPGQGLFVFAATNCDRAETHLASVLNTEMAQTADALYRDQVTSSGPGIAQRIEDGDASTKQWRGLVSMQVVRHGGYRLCGYNHVFGVASIEVDGRDFLELTESELAPPACVAPKAMSAVPTDSDALTGLPLTDVGTHGIDLPGNFVARHPGYWIPGQSPSFTSTSLWQIPQASTLMHT
jgi:hypothetical protein